MICAMEMRYWTIEQVAELTGMSQKWLWAQCRGNAMAHHRFGRAYRFSEQDLIDLAVQTARKPTAVAGSEFILLRRGGSSRRSIRKEGPAPGESLERQFTDCKPPPPRRPERPFT